MKLSKTETAKEVIILDVAINGKLTTVGLRAYTENRISKTTLNQLTEMGLKKFKQFK